MKPVTFKRGVHPPDGKAYTADCGIGVILPKPGSEVIIPMLQHLGAPCAPTVAKGDTVLVGQKVGEPTGFVSSPVHATVSGTVKELRRVLTQTGVYADSVVIENDGQMTDHESLKPHPDYRSFSKEQLIQLVRDAGIVGLGGAGFPAHIKLNPPADKPIDTIIVNAAECEPYLTTDYRVMLEETAVVIGGIKVIRQIHPEAQFYIGIETNKPEAIRSLEREAEGLPWLHVMPLVPKYPQGAEKQLIYAITGREVPSGGLPMDVGCIVHNVDTVIAIERAVVRGRPLMRKVVTLAGGALANPGNFKIRIGMCLRELVEETGGFKSEPVKVIAGGPMMGVALPSLDIPIIKTGGAFLFFTKEEAELPQETSCIRCGRCVEHCPMALLPFELNADVLAGDSAAFTAHHGLDCIECGSCSYICPAKRHLAQSLRMARREQLAKKKK